MKKLITVLVVLAVIGVIFAMIGPLYIIEEGEQAVVVQFGKIIRVETDAGLKFKLPFVDNVVRYSKKVLSWDGAAQGCLPLKTSLSGLILRPAGR